MTIEEVLEALQHVEDVYPQAALAAALEYGDAIVPQLLAVVDEVLADPDMMPELEEVRFLYAFLLLGYMQVSEAHERILAVCRLTEKQLDVHLGDCLTEIAPTVLMETSGGDPEGLKALLLDAEVYEFSRVGAIVALIGLLAQGKVAKDEVLAVGDELLARAEQDRPEDEFAADLAADLFCDVSPTTRLERLRQLEKRGLFQLYLAEVSDLEEAAMYSDDALAERLLAKLRHRTPMDDFHAWSSWWSCYERDDHWQPPKPITHLSQILQVDPKAAKKKKNRKAKKKAAKASKRKNRKKK